MEEDYESIGIPEQLKQKNNSHYDCCSLEQLASGDKYLTHIYPYQFVENESHFCSGLYPISSVFLTKTPILKGTVLGQIKISYDVHNFYLMTNGTCKIESFCTSDVYPIAVSLNCTTGKLTIFWHRGPGEHNIVVSYEYNCEFQG